MFHTKQVSLRLSCAALALGLFATASADHTQAQERRSKQQSARVEQPKPLETDGPLLMLVSLNQQRMYVYDGNGFVVQTRVSSGRTGHETPKGIYSILEKKIDHTSNIYLDAKMPHMQRLTMTGIALHGGVIPGYPASGGCVRLPYDFARRFFNMTDINQRVVIAPDVNSPISFEHAALFSALPSTAQTGVPADHADAGSQHANVADTLLGVTSAHAATEPQNTIRTAESAAEARRAERQRLVEAIDAAGDRRKTAGEQEKTAVRSITETRVAARAARGEANAAAKSAAKAKYALQSQERTVKKLASRLPADGSKMRADKLQALRAQYDTENGRIAALGDDVKRTADAAAAAAEKAKAADAAADAAAESLKSAKAEGKTAGTAEIAAKKAVVAFDRQEQNRALPVSVFVSSQTGLVQIRQGFEPIIEAQAEIENPEVPLDTFIFSAVTWKDDSKTALKWTATEVNENSANLPSYASEDRSSRKAKKTVDVAMPVQTDADKAARTLNRIKLPADISEKIAEVVKPGSTLIVSSYDVSRSETKYAGTDFIVQMPEVVAKITKPTPRPTPVEVADDDGGGCFFFCSSYDSKKSRDRERDRRRRVGGSKSSVY